MFKVKDEILKSVEKPSRYTGNELNSITKDVNSIDVRFAFCFPDVYEVGMSHLGMKILYHLLNQRDDTYCERVFAPWVDMEEKMRQNNIALFALESQDELAKFDLVGFTLQYEMSYTNILNILDLASIPLLSEERKSGDPFVCAGGPCAYNPEPLADFIDFFVIGEAEEVINDIIDMYKNWKKEGLPREEFLIRISTIQGIYVPSLYNVEYNSEGLIKDFKPLKPDISLQIRKRIIKDLNESYFPDKVIVPFMGIVHDRIMLEIFRGCSRGCRFCQAGFIYRPVREKESHTLLELAKKLEKNTGYDEISLTSLSTSDYTQLKDFTDKLIEAMESRKVNISLPSLRIDSFSLDLMEKAQKVRKSGLTFAPEAGTQRLRDIINKGVTEEDLLSSVSTAFKGGWNSVKLYFMLGLPMENFEDISGIADLAFKVVDSYMITNGRIKKGLNVTVSTSYFVPKPFTPFQWEAQDRIEVFKQKQEFLKSKIKNKYIKYKWHEAEVSFIEAVFARGDRRLGKVLVKAFELGCKFDGWNEHFNFQKWVQAFEKANIDPHFYATRKRSFDEKLPWDHIDIGVSKEFFIKESKKAGEQELTPDCRKGCSNCGIIELKGGRCFEKDKN